MEGLKGQKPKPATFFLLIAPFQFIALDHSSSIP